MGSVDVVIVEAVRSPFCPSETNLASFHPAQLAGNTLSGLIGRAHIDASAISDVVLGCATQIGGQSHNVAQSAVLGAGWPGSVRSLTVDGQAASSLAALRVGWALVASGASDLVAVGGTEHMTQVPAGSATIDGSLGAAFGPDVRDRYAPVGGVQPPGVLAERAAVEAKLTSGDLLAYTETSRKRAADARQSVSTVELVTQSAAEWPTGDIHTTTNIDVDLTALPSCFVSDGMLSAPMVAQPADGAVAALISRLDVAQRQGWPVKARLAHIETVATGAMDGHLASVQATDQLVQKTGVSLDQIDVVDVHEGFASLPLAWASAVGVEPHDVNQHGGALALGDPIAASGLRLLVSVCAQLEQAGGRYGLVVMEGLGASACAVLIERLDA